MILQYADTLNQPLPDIFIIELPSQIKATQLSSLRIKSRNMNSNTVLCTNENTFALKQVLNSNTILLVQSSHVKLLESVSNDLSCGSTNDKQDVVSDDHGTQKYVNMDEDLILSLEVISTVKICIECLKIDPVVEEIDNFIGIFNQSTLNQLESNISHSHSASINHALRTPIKKLSRSTYNADGKRNDGSRDGITLKELSDSIMASDAEIKAELEKIGAFQINNLYYRLCLDYKKQTMDMLLACIVSDGLDHNCLYLDDCFKSIQKEIHEIPLQVVESILQTLSTNTLHLHPTIDKATENVPPNFYFMLDSMKIQSVYSEFLLHRQPRWETEHFLRILSEMLPGFCEVDVKVLGGIALLEVDEIGVSVLKYFPKRR